MFKNSEVDTWYTNTLLSRFSPPIVVQYFFSQKSSHSPRHWIFSGGWFCKFRAELFAICGFSRFCDKCFERYGTFLLIHMENVIFIWAHFSSDFCFLWWLAWRGGLLEPLLIQVIDEVLGKGDELKSRRSISYGGPARPLRGAERVERLNRPGDQNCLSEACTQVSAFFFFKYIHSPRKWLTFIRWKKLHNQMVLVRSVSWSVIWYRSGSLNLNFNLGLLNVW